MGNSGSTHNLAHLDASQIPNGPWMDPAGYRDNRDPYHQLIKVLPDMNNEPRLRATTNGNILQGGGTISGRREPPPFGVYRSKSIHQMHRSQTQMNMRETQHVLRRQASEIKFKRSGSEPDLRHHDNNNVNGNMVEKSDPRTSHRAKIMRGKKKKAAPPPPIQQQMPLNVPLISKDYDPSRFGWKPVYSQKPPTPPSKETRKLRLFKTKAESKRAPSQLPSESSDHKSERSGLSARSMPSSKGVPHPGVNVTGKPVKETTSKWQEAKNKFFPLPQFRREKSFDISLLNANQKRQQQRVVDVMLHQPSTPSAMKKPPPIDDRPLRYSAIESKVRQRKAAPQPQGLDNDKRPFTSSDDVRSTSKTNDFKKELETATKRRSVNAEPSSNRLSEASSVTSSTLSAQSRPAPRLRDNNELGSKSSTEAKPKSDEFKSKSEPIVLPVQKTNVAEPKITAVQKTEYKAPSLKDEVNNGDGNSKDHTKNGVEQTKTFYFGMDNQFKEKPHQTNAKEENSLNQIQMDAIDKFAESIHQGLKQTGKKHNYSDSSESVLSSVAFDDEYTVRVNDESAHLEAQQNDDESKEHIQVHLRPTLPRRQFDIPRFSPAAAWRTLEITLDQKSDEKPSTQSLMANLRGDDMAHLSSPEQPRHQLEDRIQRVYREPILGFSDNKSGDSGISGDAGLPDRLESRAYSQRQSRNLMENECGKKVGPFLSPWTPQQDLNDDSSSDGGAADVSIKDESSKLSNGGHMFSLSLPRESHFAAYGGAISETFYAPKHVFNSLQKSKPSLANIFDPEENGHTIDNQLSVLRSDNWLLSRSAPNSIDNFNLTSASNIINSDEVDNYKHTQRRDNGQALVRDYEIQMDIQPPSFNYITSGKHLMYLPRNTELESPFNGNDGDIPDHIKKTLERKYSPKMDSSRGSNKDHSEENGGSQALNVHNLIFC